MANEKQLKIDDAAEVDPAILAEVQEVVSGLVKTAKIFRTYPRDNSISITAIDNLVQTFSDYLTRREELELFVQRHELLFQGAVVYSDADARKSFAMKLDRDGVRRVVFFQGIERTEVVGLLEVLTTEVGDDSLEDDVVTLLWDKQLQHVKVFVLDDLASGEGGYDPGLMGAGELKGTDAPPPAAESGNTTTVPSPTGMDALRAELTGQVAVCEMAKSKVKPLSEQDSAALLATTQAEETHNIGEDLASILTEVLMTETEDEVYTNAAKLLVDLAVNEVKRASLGPAAEILTRMKSAAASSDYSPAARTRIGEQFAAILAPAPMTAIGDALRVHDNLNAQDVERLLRALPTGAIPALAAMLEITHYEKQVVAALRALVKDDPAQLVPMVGKGRVATAKKLLDVLAPYASPGLVTMLSGPLASCEDAVKAASVGLVASVKCQASRDILTAYATSLNATLRRETLRALALWDGPTAPATPLRSEVASKDFDERSLDEKKMFFAALAKLEGRHAVEYLESIATQRKWFEKPSRTETRACAALGLGEVAEESADAALDRIALDRAETVATAARVALSKRSASIARSPA